MTELEKAAIAARKQLIPRNTYNNEDANNNYSTTHTRAKSDETTPVNGKGTGVYLDTTNGGGSYDINGTPNAAGSGRIGNLTFNKYNDDNRYDHPDTSGNNGQVILE